MKAIGKNIVIEPVVEQIKSESGLVLSGDDTKGLRYAKGIVLSPGSDVHSIEESDEIYYDKAQSYSMLIGDKQVVIIQERDVVIVLNR